MKKFTIAAATALALTAAAPAVADQKVSDDPFVSTQGGVAMLGGAGGIAAAVIAVAVIAVAAAGDS
jgi:hypothetical protein